MAANSSTPLTDAELLYSYLGARLGNGGRDAPVDQLLADFVEYRRELDDLRAKLCEAEEAIARGESKPLDLDALFARVDKRLAEEGIPE